MDIDNIKKSVVLTDAHILLRKPISLIKYGKEVKIRPVNWFYEWSDFSYALGIFLHYYYVVCANSKLPDSLNDLKEFKENVQLTLSHKPAWRMMCKICKYSGFKLRWMKKHFTIDDWVETFVTVFFCNITLIQKGLLDGLKAIGKVSLLLTK
jgi:hypothetical protein